MLISSWVFFLLWMNQTSAHSVPNHNICKYDLIFNVCSQRGGVATYTLGVLMSLSSTTNSQVFFREYWGTGECFSVQGLGRVSSQGGSIREVWSHHGPGEQYRWPSGSLSPVHIRNLQPAVQDQVQENSQRLSASHALLRALIREGLPDPKNQYR